MSRRGVALWLAGGLLVTALVLLAPTAERPEATRAFRRLLRNEGFQVADGGGLPGAGGTLVLVGDRREPYEARRLLRWVSTGGRLVVADPRSVVVSLLGARPAGPIGLTGTNELEPGCLVSEVIGVGRLAVRASDQALRTNQPAFVSCFPAGAGAFLLIRSYGEGTVVLLGGRSPLTNELLREEENAMLAVQLPRGTQVIFGPPVAAAGSPRGGGAWELLPDRARVVVIALGLATLSFALMRGRRLGRPVAEEPIAPIPAAELVRATARMYRRAQAVPHCGRLLREAVAGRLGRRLGSTRADETSGALARVSGMSRDRVEGILRGPEIRMDDELIHLGRDLEELVSRVRGRT